MVRHRIRTVNFNIWTKLYRDGEVRVLKLKWEGCMRSTHRKLGTWEPFQHLLEGREKSGKSVL
jgi:hypothetical protein